MDLISTDISNQKNATKWFIYLLNALTHFDSAVYLALAPILAPIFFQKHDTAIQLVFTYGIQVIGLFVKPMGAILFGILAVKKNPIIALSYGILGLSGSGILIGVLPNVNKIGCLAPLSLIFCRSISIICSSGCNTIAKTYVMEDPQFINPLRGIYAYNMVSIFGTILSLFAIFLFNSNTSIRSDFIWRINFLLIGIVGLISLFILYQNKINNFRFFIDKFELTHVNKGLFFEIWQQKYNLLKISMVIGATHITYVLVFVFFYSFVPIVANIKLATMVKLNILFSVLDILVLLISSSLLINYRSNKILLISCICLAVSMLPVFLMLKQASILKVILIGGWIVFWGVIFDCQANVWCYFWVSKLSTKYFLLGVGTALGSGLIGKSIASICWYLWYVHKSLLAPAIYLIVLLGIAIIMIFTSENHLTHK